jgi:hypothetical protein
VKFDEVKLRHKLCALVVGVRRRESVRHGRYGPDGAPAYDTHRLSATIENHDRESRLRIGRE